MPKTNATSKSNTAATETNPAVTPSNGFTFNQNERLEAFNIKDGGRGKVFTRVGTAWVNKDGSINVVLDSFPVDGKVHLRRPLPRLDGGESQAAAPSSEREGNEAA